MPLTPFPTPPSRAEPATFADRSDAFLGHFPTFVTETNALESAVDADKTAAAASASAALTSRNEAQGFRDEAEGFRDDAETIRAQSVAAANYAGTWADLTGPLSAPASVTHNDRLWLLTASLADVTVSEPGVSGDWDQAIPDYNLDDLTDVNAPSPTNGQALVRQSGQWVPATIDVDALADVNAPSPAEGESLLLRSGVWVNELAVKSHYQEFTSSGTWTKPAGVTWVYVEGIGGGGGGCPFHGGGGGAFCSALFMASEVPGSVTVTVGAGGAGTSAFPPETPNGGDSLFGSLLTARGGSGGSNVRGISKNVRRGMGGGGELSVEQVGSGGYSSGSGGAGSGFPGGDCVMGGAGGGGGYGTSAGGVSQRGGNGGNGSSSLGQNGYAPGGGGGGSGVDMLGGNGGNGRVRVWAW